MEDQSTMTTMRDSVDEEVLFGFLEDEDNSDPSLLLGSETTGDSNNNNLVAIEDISTLSDSQEKTLSMLSVVSAMLSICGSFVIVIRVLGHKRLQQKVTPYHRIMLALSLCDISASTTFALSPFLAPASTSQRVWAIGNDATCSFHGFLSQVSELPLFLWNIIAGMLLIARFFFAVFLLGGCLQFLVGALLSLDCSIRNETTSFCATI